MRKEADDTGPLAELEHWRFLEARFNSFLEQLKLPKEQIKNYSRSTLKNFQMNSVLNSVKIEFGPSRMAVTISKIFERFSEGIGYLFRSIEIDLFA